MPCDLIIRGGTVITPDGVTLQDIAIEDGKIVELAPELNTKAKETIGARGLHIIPGLIDAHVHFNEPGRTDWEGFKTGSAALAAGGGTLFFDMPLNSDPPLLTAKDFAAKKAAAEASSITDFALWGGLTPDNLDHLPDLATCGVVGFKAFMSSSGIPEFKAADDITLLNGMRLAAKLGLPVAVHAESEAITSGLTEEIRGENRREVRDYLESRPVLAELEAIGRAILFAEESGADLHIVHVSTARGVALVSDARKNGVRVTCETCPHYLHFTDEDMERLGATLKCAPPLRPEDERRALWQALLRGEIDFVASDHSPAPLELKEQTDFFEVWGGIAGVQSTLGVLLTGGAEHGLSLCDIAKLTATHPAQRFGLKEKGRLEPNHDADLTLIDLSAKTTLTRDKLLTRHQLSPYLGQNLQGEVKRTLVRGKTVYQDGNIDPQRRGKLISPERKTS